MVRPPVLLAILSSSVLFGTLVPEAARGIAAAVSMTAGSVVLGPAVLLQVMLATAGIRLAPSATAQETGLGESVSISLEGFRLLGVLSAGLLLWCLNPRLRRALSERRPYAVFLAFAALSVVWTPSRVEGLRLLSMLVYPFLGYGLAVVACRSGRSQYVQRAVVLGAVLATAVGLVSAAAAGEWMQQASWGRYGGSLGPSPYGLFCSAAALPVYGWARSQKSKGLYLLFVLLAVQLIASGTRIALAGLCVGLVSLELARKSAMRVIVVLGVAVLAWVIVPALGARTGGLVSGSGLFLNDLVEVNASGRWLIWQDVWSAMIRDVAPWGHGLGSSVFFLMGRFRVAEIVHNEYLRLLAELGPIGLALFLWAYSELFLRLWRYRSSGAGGRDHAILASSAIIAFLLVSVTDNTLGYYAIYSLFPWALAGAAVVATESHTQLQKGGARSLLGSGVMAR